MKSSQNNPREYGQSLTELAIVFVTLLVLLGGIVDLGRLLFYTVSLRDAAQEGVNYAALKPTKATGTDDISDIVNRVRTSLDSSVVVSVAYGAGGTTAPKDACTGTSIIVTVRQPGFKFMLPVIGTIAGSNTLDITQSYAGTVLRPACPAS